jgi:hypothetical protein
VKSPKPPISAMGATDGSIGPGNHQAALKSKEALFTQ